MNYSKRIEALRNQSVVTRPTLSVERARLITQFYRQSEGELSVPIRRANSFSYLMANKAICINAGELIVGEKGPVPQAAPTYPELCCHSLQDLEILNDREKISFLVSDETRQVYTQEVIPYWQGNTIRDLLFSEMKPAWLDAYEAGIFTEFMEQRAPGHTVLDDKIYQSGMLDFIEEIDDALERLDFLNDPEAYAKKQELKAMRITAESLILFAERHAALAEKLTETETSPERVSELLKIAEVCRRVPAHAPRTLWEAVQYYWFVHLGVTTELNTWDSFCPGHLDQHLNPFYQADLKDGSLTKAEAKELLQCFWIKFNNQPAPPKVGVTAAESSTYTDFSQINLGGITPEGQDAVNEMTYLLMDVIESMRLLQPSSSIQVSKKSPDQFIQRAAEIIRSGFGQPSIFNSDLIVQELIRMGKSVVDARQGGSSGCVEVGAFGKENYNLTGYFNLPKVLELTLNNGLDPRTGKQIGLKTGEASQFETYQAFFSAFEQQLNYFIDVKVAGNHVIERIYAQHMPSPFLSLLINDCITTGKDYHDGGARYNTSYIQGVGLGTMTDILTALRYHVFEQHTVTMSEMMNALEHNFKGAELLRQRLLNKTPKFGNDDAYADRQATVIFEAYFNAVDGRKNTRGGEYHINLLPTTVHVYFGTVCGALPDGRLASQPLSEGISPVQGADRNGPTAVLRSEAKIDHVRTGGTLLNQKFTPSLLQDDAGLKSLVQLVRSYFQMDGHHIQFNVVDANDLRKAKQNPEKYRDLIVRVAGYSDYFCNLSESLQDEIIARTVHKKF